MASHLENPFFAHLAASAAALVALAAGGHRVDISDADPRDMADVQATLAGDGEAFARLVRRHQEAVAAYLWRFTRDRAVWEELVQNVFVEAYLGLRGYRGPAPLLHWLRRIATRVGYHHWKQQARRRSVRSFDVCPEPVAPRAEPHDPAEAAAIVHGLLHRLSPRDRLVLTLLYLEGLSVAEAAALAGWSQTMLKVQAHRARKRARKLFADLDERGTGGDTVVEKLNDGLENSP